MEHNKAQKRLLICAAFFSFGALGGTLTYARISQKAAELIAISLFKPLSSDPILMIPLAAMVPPLMLLLCGASAFGNVYVPGFLWIVGFAAGAANCAAVRTSFYPLIIGAYFLLYTLCLLQIGGIMLRRASLMRLQMASSGSIRPDYGYGVQPALAAMSVLLLTALAFAYFVLNI